MLQGAAYTWIEPFDGSVTGPTPIENFTIVRFEHHDSSRTLGCVAGIAIVLPSTGIASAISSPGASPSSCSGMAVARKARRMNCPSGPSISSAWAHADICLLDAQGAWAVRGE